MYCIVNTAANDGIVSRHRTFKGAEKALAKSKRAFRRLYPPSGLTYPIFPEALGVVEKTIHGERGRRLTREELRELRGDYDFGYDPECY